MIGINLIPERRRLARQRRARIRLWAGVALCYTVAVVLVSVGYLTMSSSYDLAALNDELVELDAELASIQQQQQALRPQLSEQRLILAAGRSITDQPDWSLLLNHLADHVLGDSIVLTGCTLLPDGGAVDVGDISGSPLALTLTGYAKTTPDVSRFVLRLEQMSLFDKVTLVSTQRESFLSSQAIAFEAKCMMAPDTGAKP